MNTATIARILSITDTRQYEEIGDRLVPMAGTGDARECDRCGRIHEVHAAILLTDGTSLIVGTGCMHQSNPELAKKFTSGDRAAKRLAALRAELSAALAKIENHRVIAAAVSLLPLPEIRFEPCSWSGANLHEAHMGNSSVAFKPGKFDAERRECLIAGWKQREIEARGGLGYPSITLGRIKHLQAEIVKTEQRLAEIN